MRIPARTKPLSRRSVEDHRAADGIIREARPAHSSGDESAGSLTCRFDADQDMILIECEGSWSPAQIDESFVALGRLIDAMRATHGRVRVLVDRRATREQSAETIKRLLTHTETAYRPKVRIAVLVDTSLAKIRARSSIDERTHRMFVSANAAMTWSNAHDRTREQRVRPDIMERVSDTPVSTRRQSPHTGATTKVDAPSL